MIGGDLALFSGGKKVIEPLIQMTAFIAQDSWGSYMAEVYNERFTFSRPSLSLNTFDTCSHEMSPHIGSSVS